MPLVGPGLRGILPLWEADDMCIGVYHDYNLVGGGGGTPLFGLYGYVLLNRVLSL